MCPNSQVHLVSKEFNYDSMLNEKVLHKHTKINMLVFTKVYRWFKKNPDQSARKVTFIINKTYWRNYFVIRSLLSPVLTLKVYIKILPTFLFCHPKIVIKSWFFIFPEKGLHFFVIFSLEWIWIIYYLIMQPSTIKSIRLTAWRENGE